MNINEEIERIVIYQNSMLLNKDRKSEEAIENIIENIKKSYLLIYNRVVDKSFIYGYI